MVRGRSGRASGAALPATAQLERRHSSEPPPQTPHCWACQGCSGPGRPRRRRRPKRRRAVVRLPPSCQRCQPALAAQLRRRQAAGPRRSGCPVPAGRCGCGADALAPAGPLLPAFPHPIWRVGREAGLTVVGGQHRAQGGRVRRGKQKAGRQRGWPGCREASRDPAGRCNPWQPGAHLHTLPPSPQTHMVLVARWHTLWWLAGCPSPVPSMGGPTQLPPPPPASDGAGGARPRTLVCAALRPPPADAREGRTRRSWRPLAARVRQARSACPSATSLPACRPAKLQGRLLSPRETTADVLAIPLEACSRACVGGVLLHFPWSPAEEKNEGARGGAAHPRARLAPAARPRVRHSSTAQTCG